MVEYSPIAIHTRTSMAEDTGMGGLATGGLSTYDHQLNIVMMLI
jgi:hypothetical protein